MWHEATGQVRTFDAHLVGFDISGFSRFAEDWLARSDRSDVDDLARIWELAAAPQIDRLIDAGFRVADVCGDGVVAFRTDPMPDAAAQDLLGKMEAAFGAAAPALSLRTARAHGALALIAVDALGVRFDWASGAGVERLHGELSRARRETKTLPHTDGLGPAVRDEALAREWSHARAEVLNMAVLFARFAPEPWMWSDAGRIADWVAAVASAAAAQDGRLEKVTHDDKGILFRCEFSGPSLDPLLAAALGGQSISRLGAAKEAGLAVCEGRTYRGPLRVGQVHPMTIHGAAVNRAAKAAARIQGLLVLADPAPARADRLRAIGFEPVADGFAWKPTAKRSRRTPVTAETSPERQVFVGRQAQLARLHDGLATSREKSCVILVEGLPGYGKSTLARRFVAEVGDDRRVVFAQALPDDALRGPWTRLLQDLVALAFADRAAARLALAQAMADAGLRPSEFGILGHLGLELFPISRELALLPPMVLRERLDQAFRAVLRATAGETVIVIEDVQWLNHEGWRWVEMCRALGAGPLLVLTRRTDAAGRPIGLPEPPTLGRRWSALR